MGCKPVTGQSGGVQTSADTWRMNCMNNEKMQLLALAQQLPARLNVDEVAHLLNCRSHDVPVLVAKKLLRPLGNPPANGVKYFATADIADCMRDRNWLTRMTSVIYQHWQHQNARKKSSLTSPTANHTTPIVSVPHVE